MGVREAIFQRKIEFMRARYFTPNLVLMPYGYTKKLFDEMPSLAYERRETDPPFDMFDGMRIVETNVEEITVGYIHEQNHC